MTGRGSGIPVIPLEREFPGLRVRLLADRQEGVVLWDVWTLDDDGEVIRHESRRLEPQELHYMGDMVSLLKEALKALTPRRRVDHWKLRSPDGVTS